MGIPKKDRTMHHQSMVTFSSVISMFRETINLVLVVLCIEMVHPLCQTTLITTCDSLKDIEDNGVDPSWTELVIGPSAYSNSFQFESHPKKGLESYKTLKSLSIIGQLNAIIPNEGRCILDTNLKVVSFYGNNITRLQEYSFPSISLDALVLSNNNIETVDVRAFSNGPEAAFFDLSHNLIETIEVGVFNHPSRPKDHIKKIDLSFNKIAHIQGNSLPKSLKELNLNNNQLRYIQDEVFKNVKEMRRLRLSGNSLYQYPYVWSMKKLEIFDLSRNSFDLLPDFAMKNLTKLRVLDLSYNKITEVTSFGFLPSTKTALSVSLGFNRLNNIERTAFSGVSFKELVLYLYGNTWGCKSWEKVSKLMRETRGVKQEVCDFDLFANGEAPYCLEIFSIQGYQYEEYQKSFEEAVTKISGGKRCDLHSLKHTNFNLKQQTCIL